MIYVNDILVTKESNKDIIKELLTLYLTKEKLVLVDQENELLTKVELEQTLSDLSPTINLKAIRSSELLRDFKTELHNYIERVEGFIEDTRQTEDYSSTMNGFVEVSEALLDFELVANFLHKKLIDHQEIQKISGNALKQAEEGNTEYILDLIEYELLPILQRFFTETNVEI